MKFVVDFEKVLPKIDMPDYFDMIQGSDLATYRTMLLCIADDDGKLLEGDAAKNALRKAGKMPDWVNTKTEFIKVFVDALVPPASGNG